MKRITAEGLLGLIGLFALASCIQAADLRTNFIVILCDDLGYGDLGCFGHPHIQTPNLDKMAADGLRLTSCYSAAPVCSPSRVGLLTGRSPNRAGVYDWIPEVRANNFSAQQLSQRNSRQLVHMRREEITLPALLKQAGYDTAMAGKWHCNSMFNSPHQPQPSEAGFDHWFATQNNAAPSHQNPTNFVRNGHAVGPLEGFSCQIVTTEAINWLQEHQLKTDANPFFLYLTFHEPHEPIQSPEDLVAKYRAVAENEDQAQHFANVHNVDLAVGRLLQKLDELNLAENTLIYFSSDNGPETHNRYKTANRSYGSPGPLRGMKLWTTEGGFRVPGIVRWSKSPAGKVVTQPISSLDLLPTLCHLAGVDLPADLKLDGTDVTAVLTGGKLIRQQPLFWFYYNSLNEQCAAMRDGRWKLLAKLDAGQLPKFENVSERNIAQVRDAKLTDFALFDLDSDIGEQHDLSEQLPDELRRLSSSMQTIYTELVQTMHVWPESAPVKE